MTKIADFSLLPDTAKDPNTYLAWCNRLEEDDHRNLARAVMSLGLKILAGDTYLNEVEYALFVELVEEGE